VACLANPRPFQYQYDGEGRREGGRDGERKEQTNEGRKERNVDMDSSTSRDKSEKPSFLQKTGIWPPDYTAMLLTVFQTS
jgi:hypothetical protein